VYQNKQAVKLILEDGSVFQGHAFGSKREVSGEAVFSTGMIGYPESLTDPSYRGQILIFTYPLIGNYGVPDYEKEDGLLKYFESDKIQVQGLIVTNYSENYSHWNAKKSLAQWMKEYDIPGIYGIDTRELTKKIREKGTMLGKIVYDKEKIEFEDSNQRNLVSEVSVKKPIIYKKGKKRVLVVDYGVKNNIIRAFLKRNITVIKVPWNYNFIEFVKKAFSKNIPILGICLGSQILGLAAGANTYKLKYGHRSQNQPCVEMGTNRCYITSQNHGYAVDSSTLPQDWREWFYNNNDETNEGIVHISKPFFGVQIRKIDLKKY